MTDEEIVAGVRTFGKLSKSALQPVSSPKPIDFVEFRKEYSIRFGCEVIKDFNYKL